MSLTDVAATIGVYKTCYPKKQNKNTVCCVTLPPVHFWWWIHLFSYFSLGLLARCYCSSSHFCQTPFLLLVRYVPPVLRTFTMTLKNPRRKEQIYSMFLSYIAC